jgi:hypothetical protein
LYRSGKKKKIKGEEYISPKCGARQKATINARWHQPNE